VILLLQEHNKSARRACRRRKGTDVDDKQESDLQESAIGEQDQDDEQEEQDIEGTL